MHSAVFVEFFLMERIWKLKAAILSLPPLTGLDIKLHFICPDASWEIEGVNYMFLTQY